MRENKRKKHIPIILFVILCLGLVVGLAFGKYAGEWKYGFGLLITPIEQNNIDTTLRRYFRSNELLPASETAEYTVNGTSAWFTVANALDSSTVSEDTINYTLTWFVSADGVTWTEYNKENGTFPAKEYKVKKYTVEPVTLDGTVYNYVKVCGKTSSFLQEDIEAVYTFQYSGYKVDTTYSSGVITIKIDTNDISGAFTFNWQDGIVPDNSDPTGTFADAAAGPEELSVTLHKNTAYEFLFFVTDETLYAQLNNGSANAAEIVTVVKE